MTLRDRSDCDTELVTRDRVGSDVGPVQEPNRKGCGLRSLLCQTDMNGPTYEPNFRAFS